MSPEDQDGSKLSPRTDRGNLSASSKTVSMPSRARQAAAYDPAGPPPTTSTVQLCGTVMAVGVEGSKAGLRYVGVGLGRNQRGCCESARGHRRGLFNHPPFSFSRSGTASFGPRKMPRDLGYIETGRAE